MGEGEVGAGRVGVRAKWESGSEGDAGVRKAERAPWGGRPAFARAQEDETRQSIYMSSENQLLIETLLKRLEVRGQV